MKKYVLENWSVVVVGGAYTAPEMLRKRLQGDRYVGLGDDEERQHVTTSEIVSVDGHVVTTYSGNKYLLGEPNKMYLEWMASQGIVYDPKNPIKMRP